VGIGAPFEARYHRVSDFVMRELVEKLGVNSSKIRVAYHGVASHYVPMTDPSGLERLRAKHEMTRTYILFVESFHLNKNRLTLLEAFERCKIMEAAC